LAGRTAREAKENALEPIRQVLLCLTPVPIVGRARGHEDVGQRVSLTFADLQPAQLRGTAGLSLLVEHAYDVIADEPPRDPYRVSSRRYRYHFLDSGGKPFLMYHWHPGGRAVSYPHLHTDAPPHVGERMHVPSGRVSIESIVRFAIRDLGARPAPLDWTDVIGRSEDAFARSKSW
jgi:hypothetical protein